MVIALVCLLVAVVMIVFEVRSPGRKWGRVEGWWGRATLLNGFQVLVVYLSGIDPAWVAPKGLEQRATLFYDGSCGLCHGVVRFLLAEDRTGKACDLTPLSSELFERTVPDPSTRESLPDSLVLWRVDGSLLLRSNAVLAVLARLGGVWRPVAFALRLVPGSLRDRAYDLVARARKRLFAAPEDSCPIVPPELRPRFVG